MTAGPSNLYSFTGQGAPDPSAQAGLNQYVQQGQNMISPGQAQIAQSSPISAAGALNLALAIKSAGQPLPAQLPTGIAQQALAQGAQTNPNMNGQNMGGVGPTQQNIALAQGLMQQPPPQTPTQQFLAPQGD